MYIFENLDPLIYFWQKIKALIPSKTSELVNDSGYISSRFYTVTFTASGWTGSSAPYSQTVNCEGITADDNPILVSQLPVGASDSSQKAYSKAFSLITSGSGTTGNGTVTLYVYSKPTTDITIGLKCV